MTNEEIIQRGILIRDETEPAQNTSERVGSGIEGIGRNLADKDTAIEAQAARNGYYQCTVSGTTLAVTAPGFTLPAHGGNIRIKMSAPATGACTLNINGTGAKALLYNGAAVSSANTWEQNEIISVFYDPSGSGQYLASNSQGGGGKAEKIKYDNSQSGLASDNVQGALDELNNNTHELSDDLNEATNFTSENVFDIAVAAVATNNVTYVTPLKLEDGGRWTIAKKDTATNRVGHITIPVLVVGKHYKITFDYTSTLTVAASVQLCRYDSTSGSNVRVVTVSEHGSISAGASGTYSFEFTYGATTTRYLGFIFKQPAVGQLIEIHNLTICESSSVKDAVQKLINESFIQDSDADSDLDIVDPQDNVMARFYKGHIKTKNFDSSEWINLTSKFKDKKFAIVGDSISTYNGWLPSSKSGYSGSTYATYYPHTGGDVQSATQIWWYKLLVKLGITPSKWDNINVVSWSGSTVCGDSTSTTNAKPGCSDKRIADIGLDGFAPDIIIVFISCNDWGLDYALGTWQVSDAIPAEGNITKARAAYALMLHKIHTAYPKARVFCCTILDDIKRDRDTGWPSNNNNGVTTHQWNQNIKEIAEAFGCDIIDMHACGINYQNIASLVVDEGLHPNDEGHTMMAQKVFAELIAKY